MQWTGAAAKVRLYINTAKKSMLQIQKETGCDIIINGGLYSMGTFKPVCHLKADGKVLAKDQYTYFGYGWNDDGRLKLVSDYSAYQNFICCVCMVKDGQRQTMYYDAAVGSGRARTAIGTMPNGYLWIYCGTTPQTPEALQDTAMLYGVKDAVMLDGGASTQGILPGGIITSARNVHNYLCIWLPSGAAAAPDKQAVLKVAKAELGYLEKKNTQSLDDKTANAGSANFTKYARDMDAIKGWYNTKKNGYDWCAVFVEWCFVKAYGQELTRKLLPHSIYNAGCTQTKAMYAAARRFYKQPEVGDQIFFCNAKGAIVHTGLVTGVTDATVTTIEGNTSSTSGVVANGGCVRQKTYQRTYNRIVGYGRPDWSALPVSSVKPQDGAGATEGVVTVNVPTLKRGSTGATVRTLQVILKGFGYDPNGIDGSFGPGCESAVRRYQSAMGLTVDGIVGQNTWNKLMGV